MGRSRKLTLTDWSLANDALVQYFEGHKTKLKQHTGMSRTTITDFFKERPIGESSFRKICLALRLNWKKISVVDTVSDDLLENYKTTSSQSEEDPFVKMKSYCRERILNQHGRMRLLSGEEVNVNQLYVDVWLLNRLPNTYQVSQSKMLETFDLRNDRLGLGDRIQRDPGFSVANKKSRLVVLGKPGSGKTTFIKHLAVDWCSGYFYPDLTTVLIEFRRIRDENWHLLDEIENELGIGTSESIRKVEGQIKQLRQNLSISINMQDGEAMKKRLVNLEQKFEALPQRQLLIKGKLLILMDGLDEVPTNKLRRIVQSQLHSILEEYPKNRFIITCRTQVMTSIPSGFTSVEVADFSLQQTQVFFENWLVANGKSRLMATQEWSALKLVVDSNPSLKELMLTPVLLSLICLVYHDEGEIPFERKLLYKKGIQLLLSRWNERKQISKWEVGSKAYQELSVEQKEALLIEVAATKFENPKNFVLFEQDELGMQIARLLNLSSSREGVSVLKYIEAQHGLLVERADELWSFSHLTFQEYFTFQWLTKLPESLLVEKLSSHRWQEVIKQLARSQQPADRLIQLIKQAIDLSISDQLEIDDFLSWILQQAESIKISCKPCSVRAFCFVIARAQDFKLTQAKNISRYSSLPFHQAYELVRALDRALDLDLTRDLDDESIVKLATRSESIRDSIPTKPDEFWRWWQKHGSQWIEQLHQLMIEHSHISHDWRFSSSQVRRLQQYYDVNKFIVELMNIQGAVSEECRTEVEEGLLLPWSELQRRQPQLYGELNT